MTNPMYLVLLAVLLLIVAALAIRTSMLRNPVFNRANFDALAAKLPNPKTAKPGFSWSRTQIAFWTVIVMASYVYVLIKCSTSTGLKVPEMKDNLNLILLGIAGATTIAAKAVDSSQQNNASAATTSQQDIPSKGFLIDILSDENGISVHRLQNVLWTIIIGGIYIAYVNSATLLPNQDIISGTLLGLMGLSSAAYVGVKATENASTPNQPAPDPKANGNGNANGNVNPNPQPGQD